MKPKKINIEDVQPISTVKVYTEIYFGIGLGITSIADCMVIVLPFVLILISKEDKI